MYQVYYDPDIIAERVVVDNEKMKPKQFLDFLKKSTNVVSLNLIGMNVIVLKNQY